MCREFLNGQQDNNKTIRYNAQGDVDEKNKEMRGGGEAETDAVHIKD